MLFYFPKKSITLIIGLLSLGAAQAAQAAQVVSPSTDINVTHVKKNTNKHVYTNKDFYKNGIFQKEAARDAVASLMEDYGQHMTPEMRKNLWVNDFGLGDYEHVGLASITWVNRLDYGYYAMTMYLLPNQMIPEHKHMPIMSQPVLPAKHESWRVLNGWVYNFSEIGSPSSHLPELPKSFGPVQSHNVTIQHRGEVLSLKKLESWHFMKASPNGAIVDEYGNWQDRRGWVSSNSKVAPTP